MKIAKIFAAAFGIGLGVGAGFLAAPVISGDNVYEQVKKFNDVLNRTARNYVEDVDSKKLTEAAIKGMLNELDPHSSYISAEAMEKVQENFQGSFDGIGVEFQIVSDTITIVTPISGGPSEALGIRAGDKIVTVDGKSVVGISEEEVPKRLKGPKGTQVILVIKRSGEKKLLSYTIQRDKIPIYTVDAAYMVKNTDIGIISVNRFAATTHSEFVEAAKKLRSQGMKKMILDLRSNPGGYLDQAIQLADEFIGDGKKVVYTIARRNDDSEEYYATSDGQFEQMPLIILINEGSASASEIVSGAVQDLDRGLIVGETSFGKGLVQQQYPLSDGSAFRLTISRYYTPSGRLIQRPYSDKEKYYALEGREEGDEGNNIAHTVEKTDKKNRPEFKTKSGRTVYGGGGITPDFIVKQDTITYLLRAIRSKNIFWEYVAQFLDGKGGYIRKQYEQKFDLFEKEFALQESVMDEFKYYAVSKGIEWSERDYALDKSYCQSMIKAYIARSLFGAQAFFPIASKEDKQIQKAITLFPEAIKIARLH